MTKPIYDRDDVTEIHLFSKTRRHPFMGPVRRSDDEAGTHLSYGTRLWAMLSPIAQGLIAAVPAVAAGLLVWFGIGGEISLAGQRLGEGRDVGPLGLIVFLGSLVIVIAQFRVRRSVTFSGDRVQVRQKMGPLSYGFAMQRGDFDGIDVREQGPLGRRKRVQVILAHPTAQQSVLLHEGPAGTAEEGRRIARDWSEELGVSLMDGAGS